MKTERSGWSGRRISALFATVVLAFFVFQTLGFPALTASSTSSVQGYSDAMADSVLSSLKVSVRHVSSSPPKIAVGVTNTGSEPVTVLSYDSPLDPIAVQLGLVSFTSSETGEPIPVVTVQVRRKMPPDPEFLITIQPGETKEQEDELKNRVVQNSKLRGKTKVTVKGKWMSVWPSKAEDVSADSLEKVGSGEGSFTGDFESETVEMDF